MNVSRYLFHCLTVDYIFTGVTVNKGNGLNELLRIKKALIVNVKDPAPGLWNLKVTGESAHTVRVTGLSGLDFVHGFSRNSTVDMKLTHHRPIKGNAHMFLSDTPRFSISPPQHFTVLLKLFESGRQITFTSDLVDYVVEGIKSLSVVPKLL